MSKDKKKNYDNVNMMCIPTDDTEKFTNEKFVPKDVPTQGVYKMHMEPKKENTATDVYYKTECKLPESQVAIPTYDSVLEAKEWVDDINKK